MDLVKIKAELSKTKNVTDVSNYCTYLYYTANEKDKNGQLKNAWLPKVGDNELIQVFNKVAGEGLVIDGTSVTLQFRGRVLISYNYQAYKNKLLVAYPESTFDIQLVYNSDEFKFSKESGKVIYEHKMTNPFDTTREVIGAYCIIKNKRGEFLEVIDMAEIKKMRNVAKTQSIWNEWLTEMIYKSILKRACKRHFNDLTETIDIVDNENYELDNVSVDFEVQEKIQACRSFTELADLYDTHKGKVKDEVSFLRFLKEKEKEISKNFEHTA